MGFVALGSQAMGVGWLAQGWARGLSCEAQREMLTSVAGGQPSEPDARWGVSSGKPPTAYLHSSSALPLGIPASTPHSGKQNNQSFTEACDH